MRITRSQLVITVTPLAVMEMGRPSGLRIGLSPWGQTLPLGSDRFRIFSLPLGSPLVPLGSVPLGSDRFRIFSAQGSPRQIRCREPFTDLNPFPTTGDPCPAPVPLFLRGGASSKTRRTLQSGRDRYRAPGLVRRLLLAALGACFEGLRIDPDDDAELHFRKAVLHRKAGQPAEAEACWRRILTLKRPDQFCSVDQGIYGATSPCATSPSWSKSGATGPRPGGSEGWSATRARAMPRLWRAGSIAVSRGAPGQAVSARCTQLQPERFQETPPIPLRQ